MTITVQKFVAQVFLLQFLFLLDLLASCWCARWLWV